MVLQAVDDADCRFIAIDVGAYGSRSMAHEAPDFYLCLETKKLQIPEKCKLPGSEIKAPYYFVADGAHTLSERLIKPY